jgi:hypothetical protein
VVRSNLAGRSLFSKVEKIPHLSGELPVGLAGENDGLCSASSDAAAGVRPPLEQRAGHPARGSQHLSIQHFTDTYNSAFHRHLQFSISPTSLIQHFTDTFNSAFHTHLQFSISPTPSIQHFTDTFKSAFH